MIATLDDELASVRRANAELQQRLDEALAERDEAEAQKAAMAEVMKVINLSPGNVAPVFDAMLEKATVLCEASFGILMTYDGEAFQTVALRGVHRSATLLGRQRVLVKIKRSMRPEPARNGVG